MYVGTADSVVTLIRLIFACRGKDRRRAHVLRACTDVPCARSKKISTEAGKSPASNVCETATIVPTSTGPAAVSKRASDTVPAVTGRGVLTNTMQILSGRWRTCCCGFVCTTWSSRGRSRVKHSLVQCPIVHDRWRIISQPWSRQLCHEPTVRSPACHSDGQIDVIQIESKLLREVS